MQAVQEFQALSSVLDISAPHLSAEEVVELLDCINAVRSGEKQFLVKVTNRKVGVSLARRPGVDYDPLPGLTPDCHIGWMSKAPTNKRGEVYFYIYDEARALAGENGHTNITLQGVRSFHVLTSQPGPLAQQPQQAPNLRQQAPQGFPQQPQGFSPEMLMAQNLMLMAQNLILVAQSLTAQAQARAGAQVTG